MSKIKISKPELDGVSVDHEDNAVEETVVEVSAETEPVPESKPEEYGAGGTYRSIGGGMRVRVEP